MEYLGRRDAMDVRIHPVRLNQLLIPGHMGQHTQLDLGIVRIREQIPLLRDKSPADQPAQLHAHGNILQVRLRGADPARRRDRLVQGGVNPAVRSDAGKKPVRIGGFQFGKPSVFQNLRSDRMLFRQLFQHVRSGGIAGLGLLSARKLHFPEQNLTQLLGRVDVERLPRLFVDALFQLSDPFHQRIPIVLQSLRIRPDPFHFHIVKHPGEWHLNFRKQLLHIGLFQLLLKHGPGFPDGIHRVARIFQKFLRLFDKRLLPAAFPQKQAFFLYGQIQMFMGDIRNAVVIFQRVQQVGRDQHIEQTIRLHPLKITVLKLDLEGGKAHALLSQRGQTASHIICRNLLRPGKNPDLLIPGCKCQRRKTASVIPVGSGSRRLISILQHQKGCPSFLSRPDKGCFRLCPCSGNPIVLLSALIGSRLFLKSAQHVLKLQLLEQRIGFRREHLSKLHVVPCHGELRLRVDPRQRPGELRQIPVGGKGFFDALFRHLVQMRIDIVQRTKARHQLLRRFRADLRHTGNIVRGIPHEGL